MRINKVKQLLREISRRAPRAGDKLSILRSSVFSPRTVSWLLLFVMITHAAGLPLAAVATLNETLASAGGKAGSVTPRPPVSAAQTTETFTIYGPHRFNRTTGAPVTVAESFALPGDAIAPFTVKLQNGSSDGSNRVSSATVNLNGASLFTQSDFSQQAGSLTRTVSLNLTNTLEVRLASAPGSYIEITVTATRSQNATAALDSVTPTRATQGQALSVTLRGRNTHWATGQTRASFGGEVSVGGAAPGELGPVNVTDATTAVTNVVVSPTAALAPRTARVTTTLPGGAGDESVSLADALTVVSVSAPGSADSRVTTLAGQAGSPGFADGAGAQARFSGLSGIAVGPDDAIYVADAGNNRVRVVRGQTDSAGATTYTVSTLAGSATAGYADGPAASAKFNSPQGVAVDGAGNIYVADTDNHRVRRVAADGMVTTLAGDGTPGFADGAGAQARFNAPRGIAVDNFGNIYVADSGNSSVRRITQAGDVSTVAGDGTIGSSDSPAARFDNLSGIACDGEHVFVYLGDTGNHRIRRLDATGAVITVAGASRGFADGSASQARFAEPSGLAIDAAGKIVVADAVNSLVRSVDPELAAGGSQQAVTTLAGTGERGGTDGAGNVARFFTPRGVAVSLSSAVIVADTGNGTIRRILLPPVITALSPQSARSGQQISLLGERFDARAPERNTVKFTRSAAAGGGQAAAHVVSATRTAVTVEVPTDAASGPVTLQTEGGTATSPADFQLTVVPAPVITDFNPKHGPVGASVSIVGTDLRADNADPSVTFQGANGTRLPALVTFSGATETHVSVPNAAVTGNIELTTAGGRATSPVPFTVDSVQDFRLTVSPSSATAVAGGTATYIVSVNSDQTTFTQLAHLSATGLPDGVSATFTPEQITSGANSTLSVATGGIAPGSYPFTITAVAEADGRDVTRTVNATLNVLAGGQTTLAGRVLSTEDAPIMGATVSLDGRTATTDAAGSFILSGVSAGSARPLMVDGRTASAPNRTYPVILEPANIVAGRANVIPYNFYLPPIDTQYEVQVVPGQNTVAGNPRVPGLQMTVPAGANLRNRDGSPVTRVSITPLAIDRTPTPLPSNVSTSIVYTSQPGGALTDVAIPVVYPNLAGANPGTRITLYAFNHDTVQWYVYGFGRVSNDGRTIAPETDPATGRPYGLRDFSWHFPGAGPGGNPGGKGGCPASGGPMPVDYSTGIKMETTTDISFAGARGGLDLTRIHTSDLSQFCDSCPFGRGTTHNYAISLNGSFQQGGAGRVLMPGEGTGRLFSYAQTLSDGTLVFTSTGTITQLGDVVRRLPGGTLEYLSANGWALRFDSGGKMTAMTDRNGNTTTLSYSGPNLTQITDATGRSITLEYDFASRITKATDPLGHIWRYTYEGTPGVAGSPGLTTVTDPLNNVTRYGYVTGGRLSTVTDGRGNVVKQVTYDGNGRAIEQRFADGGTEHYAYTLSGGLVTSTTITDALGHTETKRFNADGYVIATVDALGQTSQIDRDILSNLPISVTGACGCPEATRQYDSRGNVIAITDRAGQTTRMEYEPKFNNLTKLTDKLGRVTTYAYDARGNLTSMTDALSQTTTFTYDGFGQLTTITDPSGHVTGMEYDAHGNVSARSDALNDRATFEYDAIGRVTALVDPLGRRTGMTYDALGRPLTRTGSSGSVYKLTYDANGNLTTVTDPLDKVWKLDYDAKNRPVAKTDPLNRVSRVQFDAGDELVALISPAGRTQRYTYDQRKQVVSLKDAQGGVTRYKYDNKKKLVSITDARGGVTTFAYDELYRPTQMLDPLGQKSTQGYDAKGNVIESVDRLGRRTTTLYDALDRPLRVSYADATVNYTYDRSNNLVRLDDTQTSGSIEWSYDAALRLLSETTPAGVVSYTYNAAGQRTSMAVANRAPVDYAYDTAGRLQTITQGAETFTLSYDALSRRQSLSRPNGVTTTYHYDAAGQLEQLTHGGLQPVEDFRYTRDGDGAITSITSLASVQQLTASKTVNPADAANRVTQFGETSYSFDAEGQIVSRTNAQGATAFQWDARGRLMRATLPDGQTATYAYDALGRRISRTVGATTTNFLYDGAEVVQDKNGDGSTVDYLNGLGIDEKLRQSGATSGNLYFVQDHLGSTAALTDAGGNVIERMQYSAFGETTGSSLTRYGYTGRELDSLTGLMFYRSRWYDPQQGRFISEDPLRMKGGLNFYAYVNNNPLNRIDPFGQQGNIPDPNNPPADWRPIGPDTWRDPGGDTWHWHPDPTGDHGGDHWDIGGPKGPNGEKGKQEWWPNRPGGQREPKPPGDMRFDRCPVGFPLGMPPFPLSDPWTFPTIPPPTPQQQQVIIGTTGTILLIIVIIILLPVGA